MVKDFSRFSGTDSYITSPELRHAVNVAAAIERPLLVRGEPGTGKTEFLVQRAIHLLDRGIRPEAITILGFSRRGVAEVRSRIRRGVPQTIGALDVATFHSYAARLLETHATTAGWE